MVYSSSRTSIVCFISLILPETTWSAFAETALACFIVWFDFSLRPILKAIEERLSLPDFVPNPVMVRFALDDFLRGNALERAQVYEILNRIGAMSVEQIQREEDLIPNEG